MASSSMARIGAGCLGSLRAALVFAWVCAFSGRAAAEHAPPPPIVLEAPPPPELPPEEWSRRPFELTPELAFSLPSCAAGSVDNRRCAGLAAGLGGGGSLLWRATPYFALGGAVDAQGFGFQPRAGSALRDGRASGYFVGLLGRVYFFERGAVEPYLELGLGSGGVASRASDAGALTEESASGVALRAGGGLEFYLGRHLRLGPAFTWTRFRVSGVQRCADSGCADVDASSYGHGTGFTSFSLRVSILIGPAL